MKKSTIIKDLIEMLERELGNSPAASGTPSQRGKVKYIDKDWGQLTMEQPPVGWPCILIDIEQVDTRPLTDLNEQHKAIIVLTVANKRKNSSSAHAPQASKEKSMETIDLTEDIHRLLQGYCAEGAEYSPLQEQSFYKLNDLPGAEVYAMRYQTRYNVATQPEPEPQPEPDVPQILTFTANAEGSKIAILMERDGTLDPSLIKDLDVEYSLDNGMSWVKYEVPKDQSIVYIDVPNGQSIKFRGENESFSYIPKNQFRPIIYRFAMNGSFSASGDVTSLLNKVGGDVPLTERTFRDLFKNQSALTSAPNLPSTTLAYQCYVSMFYGCTSLTTAPALPATTLDTGCYYYMFTGCTSLTTAPALPATTLATNCYGNMFTGCTSLTSAPALPATTLATSCYGYMFSGCTSLTSAPALPATTLATGCYSRMFIGCTSLTTAPALPATTLDTGCYVSMFYGCTSLTTAPALPATTLASDCYGFMFYGCTSLTTAPALPATTLASDCYSRMFIGCTSLTTAPALPATTLATGCYGFMFRDCTSLTTAPALPATTLATGCYYYMFYGCTSLTTAPALPATTLASDCYGYMFRDCNKLNYIKCLSNPNGSTDYTRGWVANVAASGTFVKAANSIWPDAGSNSIPQGWTVETE